MVNAILKLWLRCKATICYLKVERVEFWEEHAPNGERAAELDRRLSGFWMFSSKRIFDLSSMQGASVCILFPNCCISRNLFKMEFFSDHGVQIVVQSFSLISVACQTWYRRAPERLSSCTQSQCSCLWVWPCSHRRSPHKRQPPVAFRKNVSF